MRLTRRHVLAAGALLAGASVVGVGGVAASWWAQPAATGFHHLSSDEAAFFDALAEAIFPAGGEPALGGGSAGVSWYVDGVLSGLHPTQRNLLRLAVHAMDALPMTSGARFTALPHDEARAQVEAWLVHPVFEVRGVFQSFYLFAVMAYLTHPEVAPTVGRSFSCGFGP